MLNKHQKELIEGILRWIKDYEEMDKENINSIMAKNAYAYELLSNVIEFFDSND